MTAYQKFDLLLEKVSAIDDKVTSLDNRIASLESHMDSLNFEIAKTNIILENINRYIKIASEDCSSLSRKLFEFALFFNGIKAKQEIHEICIKRHEKKLNTL